MNQISVIILTYNESIHLRRCINSVLSFTNKIFVVDSLSTDDTVEIAESLGAIVYRNKWELNYSKQFNWALNHLPIETDWVFRLDADEYVSTELSNEILNKIVNIPNDVNGIVLPFRRVFLGREIKFGTGGIKMLRIFRFKKAFCEQRWMDEHIELVDGKTLEFRNCFSDDNLNNLSWWTKKHVDYSIREAIDLLDIEISLLEYPQENRSNLSEQALAKRKKKIKYSKQPLFFRSFVYFLYRYFVKFGFIEGKEGFLWHFLQGWWYRTLVDAKIFEVKRACGNDPEKIKEYIFTNYQIKL